MINVTAHTALLACGIEGMLFLIEGDTLSDWLAQEDSAPWDLGDLLYLYTDRNQYSILRRGSIQHIRLLRATGINDLMVDGVNICEVSLGMAQLQKKMGH